MFKTKVLVTVVVAFLFPTSATAQDRMIEIGTGLVQAIVIDGDALQVATLAGRGPLSSSIFMRVQYPGGLYIEPEVSLFWLTDFEDSIGAVGLGFTLGRRFGATATDAYWFGGAHVGVLGTETSGVDGDVAIGGTVGRRVSILDGHASVRFEGRVRHWVDLESTNVSALISFGIIVSQ